jgi:hypothetical protein
VRDNSLDLAATVRDRGPYVAAKRLETFKAIDAAAVSALHAARQLRRTVVTRGGGDWPSAPLETQGSDGRLELASFRSDRIPDQFAVYAPGAKDTQDFGYLFDLDGDGKFD